ncbi:hypothetical protein ASG65_11715 [Bacillus sp. Leaf13]|nr:hypothetical protein ASG65_11715 [Bacillus sp. Leaf13]
MIKVLSGFIYFYLVLVWILGGLMHLWTVYIAYSISDVFWEIVTLFFPVISQIVWGFNAWRISGFELPYIQWLIVLVIMWIAYFIFGFIVSFIEEKSEKVGL